MSRFETVLTMGIPQWSARGLAAGAVLLMLTTAGCSFSESSKSSSKIISSPFESISASSESSSPGDRYRADVRDFTAAFLKSGGDASKLDTEISSVAERHGVTDWESNKSSYTGMGEGLRKAGESQAELDAYKRTLADTDEKAGWMQEGYDAYKPED